MSTRATWNASALPAVVVPAAIGAAKAAELRTSVERAGYTRYALLDRGSYDVAAGGVAAEVLDALVGVASEVTGRTLAARDVRVLRLRPGDYVLLRHDRLHEDRPVELVLDLSAEAVPGAEVHYRHRGQVFFAFGGPPGALALVERGPTVLANHTYVTKRQDRAVARLVVLAHDA